MDGLSSFAEYRVIASITHWCFILHAPGKEFDPQPKPYASIPRSRHYVPAFDGHISAIIGLAFGNLLRLMFCHLRVVKLDIKTPSANTVAL